jgi:hypothetical protein
MVEIDGFEPPRPRRAQDLQSRAIDRYAISPLFGGTSRTRTDHLLLAKQALSQMSYGPLNLAYRQGFEPRTAGFGDQNSAN